MKWRESIYSQSVDLVNTNKELIMCNFVWRMVRLTFNPGIRSLGYSNGCIFYFNQGAFLFTLLLSTSFISFWEIVKQEINLIQAYGDMATFQRQRLAWDRALCFLETIAFIASCRLPSGAVKTRTHASTNSLPRNFNNAKMWKYDIPVF